VVRPGVEALETVVDVEAELGGDLHLLAEGAQHLADEALVLVRAVDLGGVEEDHAGVEGGADDRRRLLRGGEAHATQADVRDVEAGGAELPLMHGGPFDQYLPHCGRGSH